MGQALSMIFPMQSLKPLSLTEFLTMVLSALSRFLKALTNFWRGMSPGNLVAKYL